MRRNFKKLILGVTSVAILSLMVVGCGKTEPQGTGDGGDAGEVNKKPVTITLMGNQGDASRPYMQAAIANYEEKTGNKVDVQGVPGDSAEQVMLTKFATGDIPDVLMHFGGHGLTPYNIEENFHDFSDAPWVEDILPYVKDQTIHKGKVYGLPHWEASVSGMLYNKEIFADLGIEAPTTQTEFMAACETIKEAGITPMYLAFKDVWPFLYQFPMDTIVKDQEILDKLNSNEIEYADIPEVKLIVEWFKEMTDKGYIGDKFTTNTWDYAPEALGTGEYAMMTAWDTWLYTDLDKAFPGEGDKFGVMPAFMGTPEQGTFEGPNVSLLLANKNSENSEAAIEFVNFLASPENYNIAFDGINTAPVFKGQTTNISTPQYAEAEEWIDKVGNPSIAWGNIIGYTQNEGAKCLQDVMLGNKTVDEGLAAMDEDRKKIAKSQQIPGF